MLPYACRRFALIPLGASVVILIEFYSKPIGNFGVANVLNQSLKSLCGGVWLTVRSSIIFSSVMSQSVLKWTFANITHLPDLTPSMKAFVAISYWPCPKATDRRRSPILQSLANYWRIAVGSVPCDRMKMIGVVGAESSSACFRSNGGGAVKLYCPVLRLFLT